MAMARARQGYFYQANHLGSIRHLTDGSGAVVIT
jgi:uncharacterized protein RhaS with RHS repeats